MTPARRLDKVQELQSAGFISPSQARSILDYAAATTTYATATITKEEIEAALAKWDARTWLPGPIHSFELTEPCATPAAPRCECGVAKVGGIHSSWCPLRAGLETATPEQWALHLATERERKAAARAEVLEEAAALFENGGPDFVFECDPDDPFTGKPPSGWWVTQFYRKVAGAIRALKKG